MSRKNSTGKSAVDEQELRERIAFLTRFKNTLIRQRERFQAYLDLLERGRNLDESPQETLEFHVSLEEAVVRDITVFEQTIRPLEAIYESVRDKHDPPNEIPQIREALARTRDELISRARVTRAELRRQIEVITRSPAPVRSGVSTGYRRAPRVAQSATLVDVTA